MYLQRHGYDVKSVGWEKDGIGIDVVATDGETVVFTEVLCETGGMPEEPKGEEWRKRLEKAAGAWLNDGDDDFINVRVRFDTVSLNVLKGGNALLRHHINVLGEGE